MPTDTFLRDRYLKFVNQRIAKLPPDQRQQAVGRYNQIIDRINAGEPGVDALCDLGAWLDEIETV